LSKEKVSRLRVPVLVITGENTISLHKFVTISLHKFVNEELARLLPKAEQTRQFRAPDTARRARTRWRSTRRSLRAAEAGRWVAFITGEFESLATLPGIHCFEMFS
jgi:hypothetical protein